MLADYPSTPSLGDNRAIADLVKTAREKGRGASDDPFSAMKPSSFTGARKTDRSSQEKKDEQKPEKSSETKKGAKKGGFLGGIF